MTAAISAPTTPDETETGSLVRAGLRVVADAGRLLARHWPALIAVAVLAEVLRDLALDAALLVAPTSGVLGMLVLCLAPLASIVGIVTMLHIMRREAADRLDLRVLVRSVGSVLVPYLVVYEFYGGLSDDWQAYVDQAALDHAFAAGNGVTTSSPVPDGFALAVVVTVGGALALRWAFERMARRAGRRGTGQSAEAGSTSGATRAAWWRIGAGYFEVVWIVVGAFTVTALIGLARDWWSTRALVVSVQEWWQGVLAGTDVLATLWGTVDPTVSFLVTGIITGLIVPLAWLTLGTIVYGVEAIDVVDPAHVADLDSVSGRTARAVDKFNRTLGASGARRAWGFMLDPDRRFGGLVGALGMLWRTRWGAVLMFCIAFTVFTLTTQVVEGVTGLLLGQPGIATYAAVANALEPVTRILVQVLTTALLASAADALLANLGLPSALRVRRRRQSVAVDGPEPAASAGLTGSDQ